jgi:hypothetical protein
MLLTINPRLISPSDPGDYFAEEQVATWGIDAFWGLLSIRIRRITHLRNEGRRGRASLRVRRAQGAPELEPRGNGRCLSRTARWVVGTDGCSCVHLGRMCAGRGRRERRLVLALGASRTSCSTDITSCKPPRR